MRIRIFNCHYDDPQDPFADDVFATLVSGRRSAPDGSYLGDLDGENIAARNIFSEIRHQYYVWKNFENRYDYVGFEHYRRLFFFDFAPAPVLRDASEALFQSRVLFAGDYLATHHDVPRAAFQTYGDMRRRWSATEIAAMHDHLGACDIIIPRPPENGGLERQWKTCAPADIWDRMLLALSRNPVMARYLHAPIMSCVFNNMYVMKWEIFDRYMTTLMDAIADLDGEVGDLNRIYGHIGERILNFFLFAERMDRPATRIHHQPVLTCMSIDRVIQPNTPDGAATA